MLHIIIDTTNHHPFFWNGGGGGYLFRFLKKNVCKKKKTIWLCNVKRLRGRIFLGTSLLLPPPLYIHAGVISHDTDCLSPPIGPFSPLVRLSKEGTL